MADIDLTALQRVKEKSEDDFEKYIIFISSGALGLSITFIDKFIKLNESIHLWLLICSWGFFTLALCVNLWSHFYSNKMIDKSMIELEEDDSEARANIRKRNSRIDNINITTIGFLFGGVTSLIIFISINIYSDKPITENDMLTIDLTTETNRLHLECEDSILINNFTDSYIYTKTTKMAKKSGNDKANTPPPGRVDEGRNIPTPSRERIEKGRHIPTPPPPKKK